LNAPPRRSFALARGTKFSEGAKLKTFQSEPVQCLFTDDSRGRTAISGN
jgi:hypothetical protein